MVGFFYNVFTFRDYSLSFRVYGYGNKDSVNPQKGEIPYIMIVKQLQARIFQVNTWILLKVFLRYIQNEYA